MWTPLSSDARRRLHTHIQWYWRCALSERLYIVDDEPVVLEIFEMLFANEPYDVSSFATGSEALQRIRQEGVDVLLTDKNLPDVGGLELLRAAREKDPDSQTILITGYASLETALEAFQLGAFDYILKPPRDVHDVLRKVQQAFDKVRMARENKG